MSKQCSASTDLKALSLQMSRAFARDALTSAAAANHQFSKQLTRYGSLDINGAATSFLHTSAVPTPVSAGRRAVAAAGGSEQQRREATDRSEAARLGLVNALSLIQEGSMGAGAAAGNLEGAGGATAAAGVQTLVHHSSSKGSLQASHSLTPSPGDVLKAQVERILAGDTCTAKPGLQFLEKFGSRTILMYLMRVRP